LNNLPGRDKKELDINGDLKKKIIGQLVLTASDVCLKIFAYASEKTVVVYARSIFEKPCRKVSRKTKVGHVYK